jgi:hypothetical protein
MELLPGDDQLVADLTAHDQDDDFITLHIIQDPEVARAQLVPCQGIGSELLDRLGQRRRLVDKPIGDRGLEDPLLPRRQRPELLLGVIRDRDAERHGSPPVVS